MKNVGKILKKKWGKLKLKLNSQRYKKNTVIIHNIFFKKSYKANLSTSSIYIKKKTDKGYLKKKSILSKRNEKKCTKKETKAKNNT